MSIKYKDLNGNIKELTIRQADTLPIGVIVEYASDKIPPNWLLCDGRELDRIAYKNLFNIIGTKYGSGDGTNTFNLPDLRGKIVVGKSNETEFDELGKTGGEKTHTLTDDEVPATDIFYHIAGTVITNTGDFKASPNSNGGGGDFWAMTLGRSGTYDSHMNVNGKGQAHNNLQPYNTVNYIIKCGMSAEVTATVVDELNSDSSTDALSAYQGKVLNDKINGTFLFNNTSNQTTPAGSTITLTDDASKYKYIEIYFKFYDNETEAYPCQKFSDFNNRTLHCFFINSHETSGTRAMQTVDMLLKIINNQCQIITNAYTNFNNSSIYMGGNANWLKITKIIGYN